MTGELAVNGGVLLDGEFVARGVDLGVFPTAVPTGVVGVWGTDVLIEGGVKNAAGDVAWGEEVEMGLAVEGAKGGGRDEEDTCELILGTSDTLSGFLLPWVTEGAKVASVVTSCWVAFFFFFSLTSRIISFIPYIMSYWPFSIIR